MAEQIGNVGAQLPPRSRTWPANVITQVLAPSRLTAEDIRATARDAAGGERLEHEADRAVDDRRTWSTTGGHGRRPATGPVRSLYTSATVPLQWPLVGRHEELELFSATLGDPRAHGFVIHGAPGVGKTRLADQCLALADGSGRNVARATATEGSRSIPLGALAHLLPAGIGDERCDLVTVMSEVRPVLLAQARNGPLVLFVDDLHLLDTTSATFVGQLVDADLVFLVATVRSEATLPPGLDALWHRARVRRIDLDDLDRAAVDTLLHLVLRGPVEATTVTDIWTASRGNVLFVRELVLGAVDAGHLVDQHGVWRLVGPLVDHAAPPASSSPPASVRCRRQPPMRSIGWRCGSRRACRRWRTSSAATSSSCSIGPGC